jgi:hypothetical protein
MDNSEVADCPICLDELSKNYVELPCKHIYCFECIDTWFGKNATCPLCRKDPIVLKKYEDYLARKKPRYLRSGRRHKINHRK